MDFADEFPEAAFEYSDSNNLVRNLPDQDIGKLIQDKIVLDLGSGYGGRTVWYAEKARWVWGIEIFPSVVAKSAQFAELAGTKNVNFVVGQEGAINFPQNYFDIVISFDVLEHVQSPDVMMKEVMRVLKPGGYAVIIFTPYFGLFNHHLNYITLFPGIHYVFSADTLITAINELLLEEPWVQTLGMQQQPRPKMSYHNKYKVLPTVNGIRKSDYLKIVDELGFRIERIRATPILEKFQFLGKLGIMLNRAINAIPYLDEFFLHNLVSILRK
jgi:ubiquinone/menaquinone biosynthesis C-methylase UbiE